VPSHALFGKQVRDAAPISWWCLDFDDAEWVAEAELAVGLGYTCFELKGRPWRDVIGQLDALANILPDGATIDLDFNAGLANAGFAVPYLKELNGSRNSRSSRPRSRRATWRETCASAGDQVRFAIAMHYGSPPIVTALREDVCDGIRGRRRRRGAGEPSAGGERRRTSALPAGAARRDRPDHGVGQCKRVPSRRARNGRRSRACTSGRTT
jgi:hypothetical protein